MSIDFRVLNSNSLTSEPVKRRTCYGENIKPKKNATVLFSILCKTVFFRIMASRIQPFRLTVRVCVFFLLSCYLPKFFDIFRKAADFFLFLRETLMIHSLTNICI